MQRFVFWLLVVGLIMPSVLWAQSNYKTNASHALLYDMQANKMLFEKNSWQRMYPASMTKALTAYVIFDLLKQDKLQLDQAFKISKKAWKKGGSKMFLLVDKYVTVSDLLRGLIIQSGNDAAIVLAEGIDGSEVAFAQRMNRVAKQLGMKNSNFLNPTGWPDDNHYTTPQDLLLLAQRLTTDFPQYYKIYSQREFSYANINQRNRNPLLGVVKGADGIKTGYTDAAGYGLIGTAKRGNRRLVMILGGLKSKTQRQAEAVKLMNWGFDMFKPVVFAKAGHTVATVPTWLGVKHTVKLYSGVDIIQLHNIQNLANVTAVAEIEAPLTAPIKKNQPLGTILVDGKRYPLLAKEPVKRVGFKEGARRKFNFLLTGDYY